MSIDIEILKGNLKDENADFKKDIDIACPHCKGYGLKNNGNDCELCFGSGDFTDAITFNIEKCVNQGFKYDNKVFQAVARYLLSIPKPPEGETYKIRELL